MGQPFGVQHKDLRLPRRRHIHCHLPGAGKSEGLGKQLPRPRLGEDAADPVEVRPAYPHSAGEDDPQSVGAVPFPQDRLAVAVPAGPAVQAFQHALDFPLSDIPEQRAPRQDRKQLFFHKSPSFVENSTYFPSSL